MSKSTQYLLSGGRWLIHHFSYKWSIFKCPFTAIFTLLSCLTSFFLFLLLIQWVLHDSGDEDCVKIWKNCRKAMPEKTGKLILVEIVLQTRRKWPIWWYGNGVWSSDVCTQHRWKREDWTWMEEIIRGRRVSSLPNHQYSCFTINYWGLSTVISIWFLWSYAVLNKLQGPCFKWNKI